MKNNKRTLMSDDYQNLLDTSMTNEKQIEPLKTLEEEEVIRMAINAPLEWDKTGERFYETGVKNGVLYIPTEGDYNKGVAWNGLISITESPSGAEATPLYADDIKYLNLYSAEDFGATVECYTYPPEFSECIGEAELVKGVSIGQQDRKPFGISYKTVVGNDVDGNNKGYKIHLIYGAMAAPAEKQYSSINDSPEAMTLSYELTTTPISVKGMKPTAYVVVDSRTADPAKLEAFEKIIYGSSEAAARLPLPDEVKTLLTAGG